MNEADEIHVILSKVNRQSPSLD